MKCIYCEAPAQFMLTTASVTGQASVRILTCAHHMPGASGLHMGLSERLAQAVLA